MKFVATKTSDQLDLQALHRVRERLVNQRTGIINQIRAFLLERGVAVRQGPRFLRAELPGILATRTDVLSPRMLRAIEELAGDWRHLDARIEGLTSEIETLARQDQHCERLTTVPGIGPIISSAIYLRVLFVQAAWVVLVKLGPKQWERYGLKPWIEAAKKRLHYNVLAIALANKLARIAWAVLNKGRALACDKTDAMASRAALSSLPCSGPSRCYEAAAGRTIYPSLH